MLCFVAPDRVVPFPSDEAQQMHASGLALRGFHDGPHSLLQFFDRSAHAFKIAPRLRAILEARALNESCTGSLRKCLLIAFRERIGLHQLFGFVDQLVLAIGLGLADTRLGPKVMVLVDAYIAFRRSGQLDAR